ncbi:MAG: thioredoxin [Dehalococcoidia bacterium]
MAEPFEVSDDTWQKEVLESDIPVLVDFWAPWCGPCRLIAPIVEELAKEYDGKMAFTKLNVDEAPQVTMNYRIRSIPTVMFIKDGKVADTVVGAVPKRELLKRVEAVLT